MRRLIEIKPVKMRIQHRAKKSTWAEFKILFAVLGLFWIIEIVDSILFQGSLDSFGIKPHTLIGLRGIFLAPFLHGGYTHLIANSVPFLVLGWLTMIQETTDFYLVSILSTIVGGLGVWLLGGTDSVHIGASIIIYGYLGFLLLRGYFQKNIPSIFLSVIVFILFGGLIMGVFPSQVGISWQGHLFGFIGGALAAFVIAKEKKHYS